VIGRSLRPGVTCRSLSLALAALVGGAAASGVARPARAAAQDLGCDAGDREVRRLRFVGNSAFDDEALTRVVVTTASSYLSRLRIVGARRCLNPDEFPRDLLRLAAFYRKRGYPQVQVDTVVRQETPRAVDVTFRISEGRPLRVDSVRVAGLDAVRPAARQLPPFPLRPGSVFDRAALEAARDTIRQRLRDRGYPTADALLSWSTDTTRLTADVEVQVVPGPFTRLGRIVVAFDTVAGERPRVPERVVRGTLGVRVGDPVSARDLVDAQRTLYQTDAWRRVELRVDTAGSPGGRGAGADTLATLFVNLAQGDLHAARASAGWATLDCLRLQADYTDRYLLPRAQRLEVTGRVSRIGRGWPLDFARDQLCASQSRRDVYSDTVNYYLGATLRQPSLFRLRRVPSLTLFTSWASEFNAYQRVTPIGSLFSLASRPGTRLPSTLSYQLEVGRTTANPAVFCAVFSACDEPTRELLSRNRRVGVIGYALARNRADNPLNPTRGNLQRVTLRHSSGATGSQETQRFNKAVAEASWYKTLGRDAAVLTAHVQGGMVWGQAPPQERLFAGGPTTVRGFRQNELGPVVYLVTRYDSVAAPDGRFLLRTTENARADRVVPAGGNALVVGNLELVVRSPVLPSLLSLAAFTDAGTVWNRSGALVADRRPRVTPGAGIRIRSLFGAIRVDLGYNPYATSAGAAYFLGNLGEGDAREQVLYCVTPGNTLPASGGTPSVPGVQDAGRCPSTFRPPRGGGFFNRLNPSIWIGQAF
jgi:outer membrane protein insertion porin family/translocation and assembly module TamA